MRKIKFLEKYFDEVAKHYVAVASALVIGFALALFFGPEQITLFTIILGIFFYLLLMALAFLFFHLSNKFTESQKEDEHD
jgi:hypothetical protein